MEMNEIIKVFREAHGLSQDALARKVGYTDRSSIAKIEKGGVDLPRSKILGFARVLNIPRDVLLDGAFDGNPISQDISDQFLAAVYGAGYTIARGYDPAELAFNDLCEKEMPVEIYNVADLHTGRVAQFTGDELRSMEPKVQVVRDAFLARYLIPSRVETSPRATRVGQLYDCADARDRGLVDTVLAPYEEKISERSPIRSFEAVSFPKPKVKKRKDGMVEFVVFEDQLPAAGIGSYFDTPRSHVEQYPAQLVPSGTTFGVPIGGNSMEPEYKNHATAFVQSAPRVENGEVGLFSLNGEPYVKQLVVDEEKHEVRLHSFNPIYSDIIVHEFDDLRTFGKVLGSYPT